MGSAKAPKAPPPPSAPPTETSADVAQAASAQKKLIRSGGGRMSTMLSTKTNPASPFESGKKTMLGE